MLTLFGARNDFLTARCEGWYCECANEWVVDCCCETRTLPDCAEFEVAEGSVWECRQDFQPRQVQTPARIFGRPRCESMRRSGDQLINQSHLCTVGKGSRRLDRRHLVHVKNSCANPSFFCHLRATSGHLDSLHWRSSASGDSEGTRARKSLQSIKRTRYAQGSAH